LFTTVQDLGRQGYGPIGVSASGAADPTALRLANALLGNPQAAAGIEMTLQGGTFLFPDGGVVVLGGADFAAVVDGEALPPWTTRGLRPGQIIRCGRSHSGSRCYLCVRGGIRVPLILGSASTHVLSGLGGEGGRALRRGDQFEIGPEPAGMTRHTLHPDVLPLLARRTIFRVTPGPQRGRFSEAGIAAFYNSAYTVTSDANRMGIRLSGAAIESADSSELISEGVSMGSIQVPASGQPVILFVEQQTTGGYAKIANVIAADLPALGQLKPGDEIRFQCVDFREARELLYIQERWIHSLHTLI
jgi:antagonist of KipI